jgi:putative ABC transport system permease protein
MDILRDLRPALRSLARKPGVTTLAVASLGLAIGFSTAAFSVLDAYSLRDLPVREPRQLQWIYVLTRENRPDILSWTEYQSLAGRSRSFTAIVAQDREMPRVKLPGRDDFPITANVSANYFDALGVKAAMGDVFHGREDDGVVVVSHRYWTQALRSDSNIIGSLLEIGRAQARVIGVLPPGFTGAARGIAVDLFLPPQTWLPANDPPYGRFEVLGRLRPAVSPEQARAELNAILRQLDKDGLSAGPERKPALEDFTDKSLTAKLESNAILLAAMVLLILVAAANLANLRLVDNEGRRRETAIRLAIGAGRWHLARRHLTETLLVAGAGTAAGLLLAVWLMRAAAGLLYAGKTYVDYGIRLDTRGFLFSAAALLTVALIGALIPLSEAWRRQIAPGLLGLRITASSRWLAALVIAQMALVTGVTCSAGLLWRSLQNIAAIRPAMDPDRKLLLLNGEWQASPGEVLARTGTLAGHIAGLPGVREVAWARRALLSGSGGGAAIGLELPGQPKFSFRYDQVSPSYFSATGARILSGRAFRESDGPDSTPVVMVNAAFLRRFFPGADPSGKWIRVAGRDREIVGVVEDGPTIHLRETIEPYFYFPFAQMPSERVTFFVESGRDPGDLAGPIRSIIRSSDRAFTILGEVTMAQHMRGARASELLAAQVTGGLAAAGLLLAAAGLFGVSLFAVARRTPEFGVRVAMGATPARLAAHVLREAAVRIAIALPLGWALAYIGRHALEKLLYGVAPDDPRTFVTAGLVVVAVGCIAALHPALRAARIDPTAALRHD